MAALACRQEQQVAGARGSRSDSGAEAAAAAAKAAGPEVLSMAPRSCTALNVGTCTLWDGR